MQTGPDQLARSLRDAAPLIPAADCGALDLGACSAEWPKPVEDIWVRWVQLDNDPELEAVLVLRADAEWTHLAYVFDRQRKWNLVGSFDCYRHYCDPNNLVRVQRLTLDSPPLVLVYRDEGGSGTVTLVTVIQKLRQQPPGAPEQSSCRVLGWDAAKRTFVEIPEDRARYCDAQTGKPISDKSHWTGLPLHP